MQLPEQPNRIFGVQVITRTAQQNFPSGGQVAEFGIAKTIGAVGKGYDDSKRISRVLGSSAAGWRFLSSPSVDLHGVFSTRVHFYALNMRLQSVMVKKS
jgi:hypothetical protein